MENEAVSWTWGDWFPFIGVELDPHSLCDFSVTSKTLVALVETYLAHYLSFPAKFGFDLPTSQITVPPGVLVDGSDSPSFSISSSLNSLAQLYFIIKAWKHGLKKSWMGCTMLAMRNLCLPTEDLIKANYFLSNPTKETYWQAVSETRFSRWQGVPSLVYYFEITVVSMGRCEKNSATGAIGIGSSTQAVAAHRMPGWDPTTVGYHGDDGNEYFETSYDGVEISYPWNEEDVVGHGIHCNPEGNAVSKYFFTLNGELIERNGGQSLQFPRFPSVGFQWAGESCFVNLGQKPFKFDLDSYMSKDFTTL